MSEDIRKGWTSASNSTADNLCPGRHKAQAGIPEKKSDDAASGHAIHEALKTGDASKLTVAQTETHDACKAIEQKVVASVFGDNAPVVVFREQRYWCKISVTTGNPAAPEYFLQHSGQADVVYRSGTRALVIDYKTLPGDVEDSPKNLQLRDLACLVRGKFVTVDSVATAIIQPLVTHKPEVCLYDLDDLRRAEMAMFERVGASNATNAHRKAGELQCKFCLAKTKCSEYIAWAGQMIPAGTVEPVVKELVFQTAMDSWTPNQRAIAAGLLGPAGKALDEIKEFLKEGLARDPQFIPGWELTEGTRRDTITDPQACFDRFAGLGGKLEDFMKCVSVGKTKLKEGINAVVGHKGKQLDVTLGKVMEGITETSMTAPSLRKAKDK